MLRSAIQSFRHFAKFSREKVYESNSVLNFSINNSIRCNKPSRLRSLDMRIKYPFSSQGIDKEKYQKIKQQGKQFYTHHVEKVIELKSSAQWESTMSQIMDQPVLVDFYADWCKPCKALTPKLEERVRNSSKVRLLKVNIDNCQQLAHTLQIKSVPTVYLIFQNKAIDRFQGVPKEEQLDKLFQMAEKLNEMFDNYTQEARKLDQAKQIMSKGDMKEAQKILIGINSKEPDITAIKQIFLTQIYLTVKEYGKFKNQVEIIKKYQELYSHNPQLKQFYQILTNQASQITEAARQNPELAALKRKIESDPQNIELSFELAQTYKKLEMVEESLDEAIKVIKKDKNWQDKRANKFVLQIFKELGNTSPITQKYRKLFQRVLN